MGHGKELAHGVVFDRRTGYFCADASEMLVFRLLESQDNAVIAAYSGDKRPASQIAFDIIRGLDRIPEILSTSTSRREKSDEGTVHRTSTSFVFVGFEEEADADDIGSGKNLAARTDFLSPHWYRGQTWVGPKPLHEAPA